MKTLYHMYIGIYKELRGDLRAIANGNTTAKARMIGLKLVMNNVVYLIGFTFFGLLGVMFTVEGVFTLNPMLPITIGVILFVLTGFSLFRLFHYPKARAEILKSIEEN